MRIRLIFITRSNMEHNEIIHCGLSALFPEKKDTEAPSPEKPPTKGSFLILCRTRGRRGEALVPTLS
jgi:hypothetical protein